MEQRNVILIILDCCRPDHLPTYGYSRIKTPNMDRVAEEGVVFERCISTSCFTPIVVPSILSAMHPNNHGSRDPYSYVQAKLISEILKEKGYKTAGYAGIGLLDAKHGFAKGYDYYEEPSAETEFFEEIKYLGDERIKEEPRVVINGNWWTDRVVDWLKANGSSNFFLYGHWMQVHEECEFSLLKRGRLKEGYMPEWGYYDAKIELADEYAVGKVIKTLEELGVYDNTMIVICSDHGTNIGDQPWRGRGVPLSFRGGETRFPQHTTMYDYDLWTILIMKGGDLPSKRRVGGMVRLVDITPTILEACGISTDIPFDGVSLKPYIESGKASGLTAYSEDLFERRGPGALQGVRTDDYKFMRNLTKGTEALYDLNKDPYELNDISQTANEKERQLMISFRAYMNMILWKGEKGARMGISEEEEGMIEKRLRALGYVE